MERSLPLAPFTREDEALRASKGYVGLSPLEGLIPFLFAVGFSLSVIPYDRCWGSGMLVVSGLGIVGMLFHAWKKE